MIAVTVSRMNLTEDDVREFGTIWSEQFRETISEKEAGISASLLLELFFLLTSEETKICDQPKE